MKDLNLIELTDLEKRYGKKEALTGINLTIGRGKIIGLLGPNGSGKTTLIKLLNGLLQPTSGEIKVNGKAPGVDSKKIISYLPDKMYFADWMKIADLMDFFEDFYEDFDRKKAEGMCETLKINTEAKIKSLSKGNKEKVQLVLVMCRKAQLYLLDEPIAGVDPAARDFILDTILNNYNEEGTVIISTHLIAVVGLLSGIYHIYAAMVIGQLSNGNRFLFAFVAYAGLSIIVSLIGIPSMTNLDNMGSSLQNTFGFDSDLWIYLVENIVIIIIYHIVTEVILTKKLNLE